MSWLAWRKRGKKRTEIMIEIDEVTVVSYRPGSARAWCSECSALVMMVTPEQASAIARVSVRTINQMVEANAVHFIETPDRLLLVCLNSLNDRTTSELTLSPRSSY